MATKNYPAKIIVDLRDPNADGVIDKHSKRSALGHCTMAAYHEAVPKPDEGERSPLYAEWLSAKIKTALGVEFASAIAERADLTAKAAMKNNEDALAKAAQFMKTSGFGQEQLQAAMDKIPA